MSSSAAVTWVSDGTAGPMPQWINHDHRHALGDPGWMEGLRRQMMEDQDRYLPPDSYPEAVVEQVPKSIPVQKKRDGVRRIRA